MLDQVAREIAKAEDEIGKAKADMERAHSKLAKIERSLAQCRKARRWLPDVYPGWEQAEHADMSLSFDGFVRQRDRRQFEQVAAALQAGTIAKVFDTLSIVFNCDKSEICLTEERIATRNGEKMPVVYFRYVYNQAFNDVLKASGGATFNLRLKAWSVALGGNAIEYVARRIGKFYRVVIDLGRMVIMHNENVPNVAAKQERHSTCCHSMCKSKNQKSSTQYCPVVQMTTFWKTVSISTMALVSSPILSRRFYGRVLLFFC